MGSSFSTKNFHRASNKETILDGQIIDLKYDLLNPSQINQTNKLFSKKDEHNRTILHEVSHYQNKTTKYKNHC